ncbi:MAG: ATP-binding protein, partial [Myxococcota bacterium]
EVDPVAIADTAARHVRESLPCDAIVWQRDPGGLRVLAGADHPALRGAGAERERGVAQWVVDHGRRAGATTDTLPSAQGTYLPLIGSTGTIGALGLIAPDRGALTLDQRLLADTFAHQAALALERAVLAAAAEASRIDVETERLRNELLSAVSHDLRTPLASITGSATAMLGDPDLDPAARHELLDTIREEGEHLGRLVTDLLDLTRIESGTIRARREWVPVEEVIDVALGRTEGKLAGRPVRVDVPEEVLTAPMDPTLVGQVLVNLLENAANHTPPGSPVDVIARSDGRTLELEVADRGAGVPDGEGDRIFDKFYRTADGQRVAGTGLGLAICRAVVRAHGGTIRAIPRDGGGARFVVSLPLESPDEPPGEGP